MLQGTYDLTCATPGLEQALFMFNTGRALHNVERATLPMSTLANDKRSRSKKWKISGQNCVIPVFAPAKNYILLAQFLCRSRLSRPSRAPSRHIRPRPVDCDAEPEQTVKIFYRFLASNSFLEHSKKKVVSKGPASSPDLQFYAPKEAHSRIS